MASELFLTHAPDLDGCCEKEGDMFGPITIPFGAKMLFNTVKLKPGVSFDQVELAVGDLAQHDLLFALDCRRPLCHRHLLALV